MTSVLTPFDTNAYYERLTKLSTVAFWQLGEMDEPLVPEQAHVWHWDEVVPELMRSRELDNDTAGALQRRALLLRNPGLAPPAAGATQTLVAAYQMLFPGESAPLHSHSFSALRFGATGSGDARMVVDGDAVPLRPGDLLLTPAWCWHGHLHPGGDEPVVWFDGLDVPFVTSLRAGFYREAPRDWDAGPAREVTGAAAVGATYAPVGRTTDRHSPVRRYPWAEAHAALRREMARSDDGHGATLEYRNPVTGGPALATIGCELLGVPARGHSRTVRETASSVCFVARGAGMALVDGHAHELGTNDVVAIPAWTAHRFAAGDDELVLFRITDRPVQEAFGLYRRDPAT